MRQYHNSVIENEITEGILKMKGNTKNTCLSFLREIKNFNIHDTRGGNKISYHNSTTRLTDSILNKSSNIIVAIITILFIL